MPPPHCRPTRLHPALALVLAGVLHAAPFARLLLTPERPAAPRLDGAAEVEITLDELSGDGAALSGQLSRTASAGRTDKAGETPATRSERATSAAVASSRRPVASGVEQLAAGRSQEAPPAPPKASASAPDPPAAAEGLARDARSTDAPGAAEQSGAHAAAKRPIDLGLNGWVGRAAAIEGWWEPPPPPPPPSVGRLVEGLAELDAQRGLSPSSAASGAGHQAALEQAPDSGIGVFDVVTDGSGLVLSVTLVSPGRDEARWRRVGERMLELLRERRLRVPPGARGLAARLRIERGEVALALSERGRTSRGTGIVQGPLHPRETSDESTRASLEPGRLSPTLGIQVAGGPRGPLTRVVLVSERAL